MDIDNLAPVLSDQKPYRIKQAYKALYKAFITDWSEVTTLPIALREQLNQECPLGIQAEPTISRDKKTVKALLILDDSVRIETVLMRHDDGRNTVCVSSQVGCPMGCDFCATGKMGLTRSLTVSEIISQVIYFARYLKEQQASVTNVVYMGMGEPFLNYEAVIASIRILNDQESFGLGSRKISISTAGVVPGIERFAAEDFQVNLAISLHAPNNTLRSQLMPINKAYPIEKVLRAVDQYLRKRKRRVMFEYLLIQGINDSIGNARELARLLHKPLYIINLIGYNETGNYRPSDPETIKAFMQMLLDAGIPTTQRFSYGHEIQAACGQLASKKT